MPGPPEGHGRHPALAVRVHHQQRRGADALGVACLDPEEAAAALRQRDLPGLQSREVAALTGVSHGAQPASRGAAPRVADHPEPGARGQPSARRPDGRGAQTEVGEAHRLAPDSPARLAQPAAHVGGRRAVPGGPGRAGAAVLVGRALERPQVLGETSLGDLGAGLRRRGGRGSGGPGPGLQRRRVVIGVAAGRQARDGEQSNYQSRAAHPAKSR